MIRTAEGCNPLGGALMGATLLFSIPSEFTGGAAFAEADGAMTILGLACFAPQVRPSRRVFLAIGFVLAVVAAAAPPTARPAIHDALARAIRNAAITDPGIVDCGRALAAQPPGLR